ncbi:hypothetical protein [Staphylococcus delphini]|uniref:hypothetical protein n=1 Tax=Staphylococcus delphini TaxID=53344 RepID=UPI000BBC545E|nr:hypothetical protein [Staphylococcus delphini]PCF40127.1 hypothetical protein B5B99_03110 [Staphylococcus delphini]PCF45484.1 hypothetical protein B5B98_07245 [Staphylococcus delphini]PCF53868.1 hypothetical protein B5C03_00980 [Staphylococcus delphini]PCF59056.1 hypothetical protein B5B97_01240 [Staphylococcus delphini]PCF60349.1 hypothetical protein B5C05_04030 [Staphylococcus delphini]
MNWLLFLNYENGKYHIKQAGSNLVPSEAYDKVLPTTEKIARQPEKVYFDGEQLRLKEGAELLTIDELNRRDDNLNVLEEVIPPQKVYDIQ